MVKKIIAFVLISLLYASLNAEEAKTENFQVAHPEWYIKITDFNVYSARGVAIIHHVTIENTSDIAYKNVKVRVRFNSTSYTNYGTGVATETGVLPIILPPKSKGTYLQGGSVLGATSSSFYPSTIEVLSAIPVIK